MFDDARSVVLQPHPITPDASVDAVVVRAARVAASCVVEYCVKGTLAKLRVPAPDSPSRCDELWRHTCAELFAGVPGESGYCEFNFSPSTEWAAYRFDDYRQGMRALECAPPLIEVVQSSNELHIEVRCYLPSWLAQSARLQLGIAMVIEDTQGQCSYWALRHAGERPDFHHRDSFVVEL
jgi:hypothetical protein